MSGSARALWAFTCALVACDDPVAGGRVAPRPPGSAVPMAAPHAEGAGAEPLPLSGRKPPKRAPEPGGEAEPSPSYVLPPPTEL